METAESPLSGGVRQTGGYRTAIEQTETAIQQRGRYFRNQVIAVTILLLAVLVAAVMTRSIMVITVGLLVIPLSGSFLVADSVLVTTWRSALLTAWVGGDVDFAAFRHTIRVHPTLPKSTLEGMLATLPLAGELLEEQALAASTRQVIAVASTAMQRSRSDALLLKVVTSAIVVFATLAAIWTRNLGSLLVLATLLILPMVRIWRRRKHLARLESEVALCRPDPRFSEADYERMRAALQ
jgi:hypothetical protein